MFYALIQFADLAILGSLGFFLVFYILTWVILLTRLFQSDRYINEIDLKSVPFDRHQPSVSVILPVADERPDVWVKVLQSLEIALKDLDFEVFFMLNGNYSAAVLEACHNFKARVGLGATYDDRVIIHQSETPSKRNAIQNGAILATKEIAVLLDSDTIVTPEAIKKLIEGFEDPQVGGIVPKQAILEPRGIMMRLCNWYEDMRFNNTTPGLSFHGAVPCLIGRLFAMRMEALKRYQYAFANQYVLGIKMETGDDRVLTSMLLKDGYKTLYHDGAMVYTDAPRTLKQFAKQRLRWARSSFRETLLSITWLWRKPYAFLIMWADIILRWMFLSVVALFAYRIATGNFLTHAFDISLFWYVVLGIAGFFVSGLLKQIPHLKKYPQDIKILPHFLLLNTFVLFPVEIWGNLTCLKQGWMTRKVAK